MREGTSGLVWPDMPERVVLASRSRSRSRSLSSSKCSLEDETSVDWESEMCCWWVILGEATSVCICVQKRHCIGVSILNLGKSSRTKISKSQKEGEGNNDAPGPGEWIVTSCSVPTFVPIPVVLLTVPVPATSVPSRLGSSAIRGEMRVLETVDK